MNKRNPNLKSINKKKINLLFLFFLYLYSIVCLQDFLIILDGNFIIKIKKYFLKINVTKININ